MKRAHVSRYPVRHVFEPGNRPRKAEILDMKGTPRGSRAVSPRALKEFDDGLLALIHASARLGLSRDLYEILCKGGPLTMRDRCKILAAMAKMVGLQVIEPTLNYEL